MEQFILKLQWVASLRRQLIHLPSFKVLTQLYSTIATGITMSLGVTPDGMSFCILLSLA